MDFSKKFKAYNADENFNNNNMVSKEEYADYKKTERTKCSELVEQALTDIVQTDESFSAYLDITSKFLNYSDINRLLIYEQRPDSEHLASFETWQEKNTNVKRGEKSVKLFVPSQVFKDESGKEHQGFDVKAFFDISQTNSTSHKISHEYTESELCDVLQFDSKYPIRFVDSDIKNVAVFDGEAIVFDQKADFNSIFNSVLRERVKSELYNVDINDLRKTTKDPSATIKFSPEKYPDSLVNSIVYVLSTKYNVPVEKVTSATKDVNNKFLSQLTKVSRRLSICFDEVLKKDKTVIKDKPANKKIAEDKARGI